MTIDPHADRRETIGGMLDDWAMDILERWVPGATVTRGSLPGLEVEHWTLASATGAAYVDVTDVEMREAHTDRLPLLLVEKWMASAGEGTDLWNALATARVYLAREAGRRRDARCRIRSMT